MTTNDEHLAVLREMQRELDAEAAVRAPLIHGDDVRGMLARYHARRADALRWLIEQNAYGVTDAEVVG